MDGVIGKRNAAHAGGHAALLTKCAQFRSEPPAADEPGAAHGVSGDASCRHAR
jgi:hypothetical protein